MNADNTQGGAEPSGASAGSQLDAVRARLIECDREAALRGWPDTGWPRLWFSSVARAAGLDLRPTQPSMAGPGLGRSIRSPAACDPLTPAMMELIEKTRLTDAERQAVSWCVEMAATTATGCDEELAALRGLLARFE